MLNGLWQTQENKNSVKKVLFIEGKNATRFEKRAKFLLIVSE